MDEFEKKLRKALSNDAYFDSIKDETCKKEVIKMFDEKLNRARILTWVSLVFFTGLAVFALLSFIVYPSTNLDGTIHVKNMLLNIFLALIFFEATVLVKLWYWVVNTKISVLKEIKQLQLQIAELISKEKTTGK